MRVLVRWLTRRKSMMTTTLTENLREGKGERGRVGKSEKIEQRKCDRHPIEYLFTGVQTGSHGSMNVLSR